MKKLICMLLALSLALTYVPVMAASTTFSDVADSSKYKTAIYTLNDFGIILGDAGSDTFRPQANISREEFSVIMTRVLGLGALNVSVTEYPFPDVNPSTCADWSIKATKIAYDLGIIKGFEDGTFRPKEKVTFEQAVKMIVCTLGYEPSALSQGGWPTGYITVARGFGILNNAESAYDQPASREIIAQLIANSLETPLASEDGMISDRTLLSEKLKYTEGKGVVTGVHGKALKSAATGIEEDEIQIDYNKKFKVGNTSAKDYFGKQINYYYSNDGTNNILVSARLTTQNSQVTVEAAAIKDLYANKLEYYPNLDNTNVFETYDFEGTVNAIYNGKYVAAITPALKPDTGSVTLIDNNGNGAYDVVIIDKTEVYVVSAVDTAKKIIYNAYDQSQSLNLNQATSQINVKITKAGSEVEFSQIKKGDVLLVSASMSPTGNQSYNVEIISNPVSGTVTSMNQSDGLVVVGGKTYEYSNDYRDYITKMPAEAITIGDKVSLYLDKNNKILAASVTSVATTTKYGYLIAADALQKNEYPQFKIFTADNKIQVFQGVEKVKVNGVAYNYDNVLDAIVAANSVTNKDAGATGTQIAQLIEYTTNPAGKIDNIFTIKTSGDVTKALVLSKAYQANVTYTSSNKQLGSGVALSSSTKVFFIPTDRSDTSSYSTGTYSKFKNQSKYSFEAYDSSATGVPNVVVVYGDSGLIGIDDPAVTYGLVESIKETVDTSTGSPVATLTCYVDGSTKKNYLCETPSILSGYVKGDVLRIALNAKGYIKEVKPAFDVNNIPAAGEATKPDGTKYYPRIETAGDSTTSRKTVFGTVYARDEEYVVITPHDVVVTNVTDPETNEEREIVTLDNTKAQTITVSSSTKVYVLDAKASESSSSRLTESTVDAIAGFESSVSGASQVFAFIRNNSTKFLLIVSK